MGHSNRPAGHAPNGLRRSSELGVVLLTWYDSKGSSVEGRRCAVAKVIVDDALRATPDLTTPTAELCDADGTAIAYVASADKYRRLVREAMAARHTDERAAQSWAEN